MVLSMCGLFLGLVSRRSNIYQFVLHIILQAPASASSPGGTPSIKESKVQSFPGAFY